MRAYRVDANQKEIVEAFRAMGATVMHTHTVGNGAPDIVVGYQKKNYLFEIKDGTKPKSAQKLTDQEKEFHKLWKGQVRIISDVTEVVEIMNALTFAGGSYNE